ncbi:MAG: N-acetyltransferase [Calditrichaeota bacterium]|nr:MAG: N-acetyltransferase [Calditrichota bacterium]
MERIYTSERLSVRLWRRDDAPAVARHADNRKIWLNLRDAFPFPYALADAQRFIEQALAMKPQSYFCIASPQDEAIGSIGFIRHQDVERFSAEIGYWLSEEYWGRGLTSEALSAVTRYAMETYRLIRIYATPFAHNAASCRVLEKCGYLLEGRLRRAAVKDGKVVDMMMYAFTKED